MSEARFEFDEDFNEVVERADRREMMRYRNAIINELRTRKNRSIPYALRECELKPKRDEYTNCYLMVDILLIVVMLGLFIVDIIKLCSGEFSPIRTVIIVVLDALIIFYVVSSLRLMFRNNSSKKPIKKTVVSAQDQKDSEPLQKRIRKDSTKLLEKKQEILDRKLGL